MTQPVHRPRTAGHLNPQLRYGEWASVHEVGQLVAAASPAGAAVVATAVVVKLTRVLMLAPVVAVVSVIRWIKTPAACADTAWTPLVPLFVLGFIGCVALRSTGLIPEAVLGQVTHVQVAALGAALFGMGCSVKIASLVRKSGAVMVVSTFGTLFIGAVTLAGILLVSGRWARKARSTWTTCRIHSRPTSRITS